MSAGDFTALGGELERELPAAIGLRHEIHAHPHVSGPEGATRDLVLDALPGGHRARLIGEDAAALRLGGTGPAVAARAELDALEVTENTGVPWSSVQEGVMHGCGHDVHLAALVALARTIDRAGADTPLLALLQPREETYPSGAHDLVHSGVLDEQHCVAVVGAHVQPLLPAGTVACAPGVVNGSSDEFTVTVHGTGGHAAYPHRTRDPVVALAQIVVALQSLVSRGVDPMSSVVLSVTTLDAGGAANVAPSRARARGTIRATTTTDRDSIHSRLAETSELVARAHGCTAEVEIVRGEPVLHNDAALAGGTADLLQQHGVPVDRDLRSTGSDDFSYYSQWIPSLMLFVGTHGGTDQLHSATFLPPDECVRDVARALLAGYLTAAHRSVASSATSLSAS